MIKNQSLVRKIAYITAIALLLIPLSRLSEPATLTRVKGGSNKVVGSPGGTLSRMRAENGLAPAELGEIDPASATMKFATLGMRPLAVSWLWHKANEYKKFKDWDKLEATVEQIIRLQPNDLEVWDFQAHNLSYNVSVEFDDYRYRYAWVKNGIGFLVQGTEYNRDEPGLLNQIGWFTGQKIGRSDEAKQFRRLFKDDKEFHKEFFNAGVDVDQFAAKGADSKPDNWLVARLWYDKAVDAARNSGRPIRGKTPLLFYSGGPMSLINGAAAIEKDGYFGERALTAWEMAAETWYGGNREATELRDIVYGNRSVPTSAGFDIRLNDAEEVGARIKASREELDKLAVGVREKIIADRKAALPENVRAALDAADDKLTPEQQGLRYTGNQQLAVKDIEVARQAKGADRVRAFQLADLLEAEEKHLQYINIYRGIVNFDYWRQRCKAEREPRMLSARKAVFDADTAAVGEDLETNKKRYESAWEKFAAIFADYPDLMANPETEELVESVEIYHGLLGQLDKPFPRDFVLNNMLEKHPRGRKLLENARRVNDATTTEDAKPEDKKPEDVKPEDKKPAEPKPDDKKPEEPKVEDKKPEDKKPEADKGDAKKPEEPKAEEPKAEEKKPEEKKDDEKKPESPKAAG
ncbi:hypothetical protein [Anatilimnocola floriformis]|uniref:hypothetical protein n=1 Tax=Anatilimnocola floriformis TaxID=2948575 RepID=UPI0020C47E17|nr:hypothetical protein [Anatilimnocola floriformis]